MPTCSSVACQQLPLLSLGNQYKWSITAVIFFDQQSKAQFWSIVERSKYRSIFLHKNHIYNLFIIEKSTKYHIRTLSNQNKYIEDLMHIFGHWLINRSFELTFILFTYVSKILLVDHKAIYIITYCQRK